MNIMASLEFSDATSSSTPPKLSLFSSIPGAHYKPPTHDPPGMETPPVNSAVSIPFQWEEAPGKPRRPTKDHHQRANITAASASRRLELPPRMLVSDAANCCRVSSMPSPTTVLDGPEPRPTTKPTPLSFRSGSATLSRRVLAFGYGPAGSGRWKSAFRKSNVDGHVSGGGGGGGTFDAPPSTLAANDGGTSVKITRVIRRRASFLNLSHHAGANVLANIYEGLKQAVPWRRVQHEKIGRKKGF